MGFFKTFAMALGWATGLCGAAALSINPSSVELSDTFGTSAKITVANAGPNRQSFTVVPRRIGPWLSITPSSGTLEPGQSIELIVEADTLRLRAGEYRGAALVESDGFVQVVPVKLIKSVQNTDGGGITVAPAVLSVTIPSGQKGAAQSFHVLKIGQAGDIVDVRPAAAVSWLQLDRTSAAPPATFTVTMDAANLAPGSYTNTLVLSCSSNYCLVKPVTVNLTVTSSFSDLSTTPKSILLLSNPAGAATPLASLTLRYSGPQVVFTAVAQSKGNWLKVIPEQGTIGNAPVTLTIQGDFQGGIDFPYSGTVLISANGTSVAVPVWAVAQARGIVSAATFTNFPAPGAIVSIFGDNLVPGPSLIGSAPFASELGGVSVSITDEAGTTLPCGMIYISADQINVALPERLVTGNSSITVARGDEILDRAPLELSRVGPGLFTANAAGVGPPAGASIRASGLQTPLAQCDGLGGCLPVPIELAGEAVYLTLYGTGIRNRTDLAKVQCTIGGFDAKVLYAGPQFQFAGLDQVNVLVPPGLARQGNVNLLLTVDGALANPVQLSFK